MSYLRSVFSDNLRYVIESRDLRVNWVASAAGISRAQIYNVLAGRSCPSLDWVEKIANVVGVPPSLLLGGPIFGQPPPQDRI